MTAQDGRIVSNLRIASEEIRAQGADIGWQMACEEAARVLALVETRMLLLARTSSEPAQSAAIYMRKIIRDGLEPAQAQTNKIRGTK